MSDNRERILALTENIAFLLKESEEYADFAQARDALLARPESVELLNEYRSEQTKIHLKRVLGQSTPQELTDLDALYDKVAQDEYVMSYINAEMHFGEIMHSIQDILEKVLGEGTEEDECIFTDGSGENMLN